jgi:hypothetical protein
MGGFPHLSAIMSHPFPRNKSGSFLTDAKQRNTCQRASAENVQQAHYSPSQWVEHGFNPPIMEIREGNCLRLAWTTQNAGELWFLCILTIPEPVFRIELRGSSI